MTSIKLFGFANNKSQHNGGLIYISDHKEEIIFIYTIAKKRKKEIKTKL